MTSESPHHLRPDGGKIEVTTAGAGWRFLEVTVLELAAGTGQTVDHQGREAAFVPLAGSLDIATRRGTTTLRRLSLFEDAPSVLYVPPAPASSSRPATAAHLSTAEGATVAIGTAPAEGRHPERLFTSDEMRLELRGGGTALRQVTHVLATPLPAERLIVYEIVAPRGTWCGWPPHCHDGYGGSPYFEETYYFRFDPADGFAFHRNYRVDGPLDETFVAGDGEMVLVPEGFHTTAACAGAHMYFLNFLAGEGTEDERALPPCFDARYAAIAEDWDSGPMALPTRPLPPG